mmetsp:Transcript_4057/g.11785  ORF Transcript_4057/g.11785 Transcript_4057/m.11785 type:complete len:251 (+) Transcript_4057:1403-2155(+)
MNSHNFLFPEEECHAQEKKAYRGDVAKSCGGSQDVGVEFSVVVPAHGGDQGLKGGELQPTVQREEHQPKGAADADSPVQFLRGMSERNAGAHQQARASDVVYDDSDKNDGSVHRSALEDVGQAVNIDQNGSILHTARRVAWQVSRNVLDGLHFVLKLVELLPGVEAKDHEDQSWDATASVATPRQHLHSNALALGLLVAAHRFRQHLWILGHLGHCSCLCWIANFHVEALLRGWLESARLRNGLRYLRSR